MKAQAGKTSRSNSNTGAPSGNLMTAGVAGTALLMAGAADAAVVYSGVQNLTATGANVINPGPTPPGASLTGGEHVYVDLLSDGSVVSDGVVDFSGTQFAFGFYGVWDPAIGAVGDVWYSAGGVTSPGLSMTSNFLAGETIGAGSIDSPSGSGFEDNPSPLVKTTFYGVSIDIAGATHYGWIQVEKLDDVDPLNDYVTVIDWAYEDVAGASIQAGVVPLPAAAGLYAMATGVLGLAGWRRKRKQQLAG